MTPSWEGQTAPQSVQAKNLLDSADDVTGKVQVIETAFEQIATALQNKITQPRATSTTLNLNELDSASERRSSRTRKSQPD